MSAVVSHGGTDLNDGPSRVDLQLQETPQEKDVSRDVCGQLTSPLPEITIPPNFSCRMCNLVSAMWHLPPSCWNQMSCTSISFNLDIQKS